MLHFLHKVYQLLLRSPEPRVLSVKGLGFNDENPEITRKRVDAIAWLGRRYVKHPEFNRARLGGMKVMFVEGQP